MGEPVQSATAATAAAGRTGPKDSSGCRRDHLGGRRSGEKRIERCRRSGIASFVASDRSGGGLRRAGAKVGTPLPVTLLRNCTDEGVLDEVVCPDMCGSAQKHPRFSCPENKMTIYFLQPLPETRNKEAHVFKEEGEAILINKEFTKLEKMHVIGLKRDSALRFRLKKVE
jgi:hypothetical protein